MVKEYVTKISKDTLLILAFNAVSYLCSFMIALLIAKFLGIEILGEYSLIFAFVSILGMVSDFGLSTLIVRKINEHKFKAEDVISLFNKIKFLLSLVIIVILLVLVLVFFNNLFYPAFFIGAAAIFPRSFLSTYESSLRSFLNQFYPVLLKSMNSVIQLAVSFILLLKGHGLAAIFTGILAMDILTAVILSFVNSKIINNYTSLNKDLKQTEEHVLNNNIITVMKESYVFFINNFLMLSMKGLNVIFLGYFSTAVSVGIYTAGSRFINGIGLLSGALFNSFYPAIANAAADVKIKINIVKRFIFYSFTLGLIITLLMFFLSDFLINITFKTTESVLVLKILSLTIIPVLVYTVTQSFLFSIYGEKYLMKILIITWSLNIILSIILIGKYDYAGCAAALASTEVFLMLAQLGKFNFDVRKFEIQKITAT